MTTRSGPDPAPAPDSVDATDRWQAGWLRGVVSDSSVVALGTLLASILGYGFAVVLSRSLGPATYGALGALLAIAIISTIPATALQLVIARRLARDSSGVRQLLTFSIGLSIAVSLAALLLAPLVAVTLHLDSVSPALWLAVLLAPQTMVGAFNGILLGRGHMVQFALGLVVVAGGRLAAGFLAAQLSWSLAAAMAAAAVAAVVTMGCVGLLAFRAVAHAWTQDDSRVGGLGREVWLTAVGLTSLLVLVNIDVLAARVVLPRTESGLYAFATLFGRASLWGTQFLGLAIYPRLVRGEHGRRLLAGAVASTAAIGLSIVIASGLLGDWLVTMLAGPEFDSASDYAMGFAAAGVLLALVQVMLLADIARSGTWVTRAIWLTALAFAITVALAANTSIKAVLVADLLCLALGTAASLAHLARGRRR